jgi:3-carboxy-cis,cis-muconate cycloisomerase
MTSPNWNRTPQDLSPYSANRAGDVHYYDAWMRSADMRSMFSQDAMFRSWLDVEGALARAEARVGLVPPAAADEIVRAASVGNVDVAEMTRHYQQVGFPIVPLVRQLTRACGAEAAGYVHWGATTQDVVDTGLVLQIRDGLRLIEADLEGIITAVARLCFEHRDTVMVGRTFQQHAAPITFGYKAAVWLDELLRHRERLGELRRRVLVVQFGGAVGTLATLGPAGLEVRRALAEELDLGEPAISWHTARDGWAELVFWLAAVGATLAKMASEIATLMRTEIDEVREPHEPGRGGSSAMPQKRNPVSCPVIIANGQRLRDLVPSQLAAMVQDHERAVAGQSLEWQIIPQAFLLLSGSLMHSRRVLEGLDVNVAAMRRNLENGRGFLMAEAVMMGLAAFIGRSQAHTIVEAVAGRALDARLTLREGLLADPVVMTHLTVADLDRLLDPANSTGSAGAMVDAVLARVPS